MTGELPLEEQVERHLEANPEASIPELAGAIGASPEAIREIVDGESHDSAVDSNTKTRDRVRGSRARPSSEGGEDLWTAIASPNPVYPDELLDREYWVSWILDGKERKRPVAPWQTGHAYPVKWRRDLPEDERPETTFEQARRWTDFPLDHLGLDLPDDATSDELRLGIVIPVNRPPREQRVTLIDWDDVRDPDTGEVHPTAASFIQDYGGYVEISRSGKGLHQFVVGGLPGDRNKLIAPIADEAFVGDDLPGVELYDGGRHVAMTGDHVEGTERDLVDGQDCINEIVDEFGPAEIEAGYRSGDANAERERDPTDEPERPEHDVDVEIGKAPDELPTCYARALEARVNPNSTNYGTNHDLNLHVALLGVYAGYPIDELTEHFRDFPLHGDTSNFDEQVTRQALEGTKRKIENDALAPPSIQTLREKGILDEGEVCNCSIDYHGGSSSKDHDDGRDELPALLDVAIDQSSEEDDVEISGRAVSALPTEQLDALDPADRRRYAKKRGLEWPSTADAREQLFASIAEVMRNEDDRVVDAPTSLGKSYTTASTRWGARTEITGERPVVHLLETRDARDEAVDVAEEHGGQYHVLLGRHEACPVCAGEHDDEISIEGEPASDWLDRQCEGKGMPFSAAHRYLEDNNDQGVDLPCGGDRCTAITQWETYREGPDGALEYWPMVIATHNFAYAPGLRTANNVVVDEEPSYETDLSTDRIRSAVGAYLREIDAPVSTWEAFVQLSRHDDWQGDAARERDALEDVLWEAPDHDWYFENPDAHTLAPALARAIFRADERANGRRFGKTMHEPPRLEAGARNDDDWNREWVSVVLDESNDVRSVRVVPDFGSARSLIGLDAHPAVPLWQANTVPWIKTTRVLDPDERQLWRRYERGLRVVQVGDATRPLSGDKALEWLDDEKLSVLLEHLVDEHGAQFRTAITTAQVEDRLDELMEEAGCYKPELMHFGEEKSRNDFQHERVGLVNGCMDPGDDYVLDLLAELDLEAEPETDVDSAGEEYRARGRGFDGVDAETAQEILASVRENHIAQAAGRYARDPTDPEVTATVFVRTDAIPAGFADVQVPGVEWVWTDLQEAIVDELRSDSSPKTAREIADAVGCSKEHVRKTLERLADPDQGEASVQVASAAGEHGATLYSETGLPNSGVVDIHESPTVAYRDTSRWTLAIRDPTHHQMGAQGGESNSSGQQAGVWDWKAGPDPGD